jgi:hypothetical protein
MSLPAWALSPAASASRSRALKRRSLILASRSSIPGGYGHGSTGHQREAPGVPPQGFEPWRDNRALGGRHLS